MNRRFLIIVCFLAFVIYLVGFRDNVSFLKIHTHAQGSYKVQIELAITDEEKRLGLMGREELPEGTGMLFVYEENSDPIMWMKNMTFPIDIVFIGEDKMINYIEKSAEPCNAKFDRQCNRYGSAFPSKYVLELPAGFTSKNGIDWRDQVVMPLGI